MRVTSGFQVLFQLQGEKIGVCLFPRLPGAKVVGQTGSRPRSGSRIPKNPQFLPMTGGLGWALAERVQLAPGPWGAKNPVLCAKNALEFPSRPSGTTWVRHPLPAP